MIKLFRDLHIAYYVVALLGGLGLIAICAYTDTPLLLGAILALFWIGACAFFFFSKAKKRFMIINELRTKDCNVTAYTAEFERIWEHRHSKKCEQLLKTNLSTGYHDLGQPEKALEILSEMPPVPNSTAGADALVCYYNNIASCYLQLYNADKAQQALENMKNSLNQPRLHPAHRQQYEMLLENKWMVLRMLRGDYSDAREFFIRFIQRQNYRLGKVSGNFYLAKVYIHEGNMEKAAECVRYVAENGGDTFYAAQAKSFRL